MIFWDSSALTPLLLTEKDSDLREAQLREDPGVVVWYGTLAEIDPRQLGQHTGIILVALAVVLVDRSKLPGIGHQASAAVRFKQSTNPRAVGAHFYGKERTAMFMRKLG